MERESCLRLGDCVWDGGEERVLPKCDSVRESCAERGLPGETVCRRTAEQRAGEEWTLPKAALCGKTVKRQVLLKATMCEKAAKSESCQKRPCARRLQKDGNTSDHVREACERVKAATSDRARSLRRGSREDCGKAKAVTSDRVREACEGVREKTGKGRKPPQAVVCEKGCARRL